MWCGYAMPLPQIRMFLIGGKVCLAITITLIPDEYFIVCANILGFALWYYQSAKHEPGNRAALLFVISADLLCAIW